MVEILFTSYDIESKNFLRLDVESQNELWGNRYKMLNGFINMVLGHDPSFICQISVVIETKP